jgi:putative membrane protein (TIGR04086 family)
MYNKETRGGLPTPRKHTHLGQKRRTQEEAPLFKRILSCALWGLLINALSGVLLVSIVCFIAYSSSDPLAMIPPMSLLALLPSNFLGGFVASKKCGESPIACGIATAAMWGAVSFLGALCLYSIAPSGYELWQSLLLHALSLAFCLLGAMAGGIKRIPSRKKRRFG